MDVPYQIWPKNSSLPSVWPQSCLPRPFWPYLPLFWPFSAYFREYLPTGGRVRYIWLNYVEVREEQWFSDELRQLWPHNIEKMAKNEYFGPMREAILSHFEPLFPVEWGLSGM